MSFMAKFCPNCGSEVAENSNFCTKCGTNLGSDNTNNGSTVIINNYSSNSSINLPNRSVVTCVILSIITCGIYSIYWFIVMTDETNMISDEKNASGGMAFLFTILTCGIYAIYWNFKMGQKLFNAGKKYNKPIGDNSIFYLILSLIGFSIVNYCLIQSDLNKFSQE